MQPRINCITLAVEDLERSLKFYRDSLGLPTDTIADLTDHVVFNLQGGLHLVLILRAEFNEFTRIAGQADSTSGSSNCILSYFATDKGEVDAVLKRAEAASGARSIQAKDQPWGYAGYFTDPDGNLWEVMWNPRLQASE